MELNYVITITDRSKRDEMAALYSNNGLHMTLTHLGKGTATTEHLSIYGLEATDKAIICAVAGPDSTKQLIKAAKRKMFMDIPGNGIMMSIPVKRLKNAWTNPDMLSTLILPLQKLFMMNIWKKQAI